MVPVPKARRVTFTPDLPSVTQSVAVWGSARSGKRPAPTSAPAANPVFRKFRLEQLAIRYSNALNFITFAPSRYHSSFNPN
jgi:hypothetical protein